LCDIREPDLGIDVAKAEQLITKRTKAIIPLSFAGIPCDLEGVYRLAETHGLRVVEDDCHAFGTTVEGRKIGSFGDLACFSFDPVKIVTSIDGGCVVVTSEEELERLRRLRLLGVDKDTLVRYKNSRAWDYDVVDQGFRYHLTNIMASVGISQIMRADEFIASRRLTCQVYSQAFGRIDGLKLPATDFTNVSPFIYSLRVLAGRREAFIDHLSGCGVDVGIHFIPVHKHTSFREARSGDMTVTDRVVDEVVTLPLHSKMEVESVERVVDAVCSFFD
jgi:dTDP-4-amino-4,6-dideoxygalactose transaminase